MPLYGFAREEMSFSVIACYLALLISCPWNTDSSADQKFLLCLAHTKTNMAQPTQQGSLRLSTVLSGYLFYKHWNYTQKNKSLDELNWTDGRFST